MKPVRNELHKVGGELFDSDDLASLKVRDQVWIVKSHEFFFGYKTIIKASLKLKALR